MRSPLTAVALISSLVLAAVFAVAAVTKLADRTGTRRAVVAFDAPEWSAGALALILPLAELTVAGLLLSSGTAAYGAIGALVLLAIFSVAIAVSLARGRAPDCHCFGQLHSAPASWKTLARNGVLAALAVVSLVGNLIDEQKSAFAWLGDREQHEGADGASAAVPDERSKPATVSSASGRISASAPADHSGGSKATTALRVPVPSRQSFVTAGATAKTG